MKKILIVLMLSLSMIFSLFSCIDVEDFLNGNISENQDENSNESNEDSISGDNTDDKSEGSLDNNFGDQANTPGDTPDNSTENTPGSTPDNVPDDNHDNNPDNDYDDGQGGGNEDSGDENNKPTEAHRHTDDDENEICDVCFESVIVIIDFYAINDLHGKFCDSATQPGVDELATYLKSMQSIDDNVVFLSSGDMWQGGAESNLTGGAIIVEWMNSLGFVSMTLGNHEYDWGEEAIRQNTLIAEFPFLAINVYEVSTGKRPDYCQSSIIVERDGVQIGIIGAIGDCYSSISSDKVENIAFKTGSELAALVQEESQKLRNAGANIIVYSLHDGYESGTNGAVNVSNSELSAYYQSVLGGYVDLVFESHTHQSYILVDASGIYHIQGGAENYGISHIEIEINSVNGKFEVSEAGVVKNSVYSQYEDDAETKAIENKYADVIDKAYSVLGMVSEYHDQTSICDYVAELYLEAGLEEWGEKYDIVLAGGYISTRTPYNLTMGQKTYADILSLFPFDNNLVLCSVSGQKLLSKFINTTNESYHIAFSEYGESIKNQISASKTYYIVVDKYSSLYKSNGLTEIEEYPEQLYARDLLANAIKEGRLDNTSSEECVFISITEALALGNALEAGETTATSYYIKGKIKDVPSSNYGNFTLVDNDGNEIYVYGIYDISGNRYDSMANKPQQGDTVVLLSKIMHYSNAYTSKIELVSSVVIEFSSSSSEEYTFTSITEALSIGSGLSDNSATSVYYYLKGKVKTTPTDTYGNFTLEDDEGNEIYVYGLYDLNNNIYGNMTDKPSVGDTVIIRSVIYKYVKTGSTPIIELKNAVLIEKVN